MRYNTSGSPLLTTSYAYDAAGRVSSIQNLLSAGTTSYSYSYDADSRTTQVQQTAAWDNYTTTYAYDHEGQLTGTSYSGSITPGTKSYAYDANGNRTAVGGGAGSNGTYTTATDNRLTNAGTYGYTYDNEGRRLTRTAGSIVDTYSWDSRGRLTSVVTANSGTATQTVNYIYDAMDRRICKQVFDGSGTRTVDELAVGE